MLPPFLDPDLQVSQSLVPIMMSEETLTFGMERGLSREDDQATNSIEDILNNEGEAAPDEVVTEGAAASPDEAGVDRTSVIRCDGTSNQTYAS